MRMFLGIVAKAVRGRFGDSCARKSALKRRRAHLRPEQKVLRPILTSVITNLLLLHSYDDTGIIVTSVVTSSHTYAIPVLIHPPTLLVRVGHLFRHSNHIIMTCAIL